MRILLGTKNVANTVYTLRKAFRCCGFEADVAVHGSNKFYDDSPDHDISPLYELPSLGYTVSAAQDFLQKYWQQLLGYDLYIFSHSCSLLPRLVDLPILKMLGKKVIMISGGSDTRHGYSAKNLYKNYHIEFPNDLCVNNLNPICSIEQIFNSSQYGESFVNKLHNIRMTELFTDCHFTDIAHSNLGIKPYFNGLVWGDFRNNGQLRKEPKLIKILHAPSRSTFKQSSFIIETFNKLHEAGYKFEYSILRNLDNKSFLGYLSNYDILVDQVAFGKPALLAHEAMSSGMVVLGPNDDSLYSSNDIIPPVIGVNNNNLYRCIAYFLENPKAIRRFSEMSLDYMSNQRVKVHDIPNVFLDSLSKSEKSKYGCYPLAFYDFAQNPHKERLPHYLLEFTDRIIHKFGTPDLRRLKHANQSGYTSLVNAPCWQMKALKSELWGFYN
jgi:hypothetical protein